MMAEEEKPFKCYQPECGMRFTNEDHLSVHMKKHDMSLALNLGPGLGVLSPMGLCDQTPTPTKFLKNCEELGLFQELSKNPFDDSFKKALDGSGEGPDTSEASGIPGPGAMMNLDTPLPSTIQIPKIITDHVDGDNVKSPTKSGTNPLASVVPKKREKFLSSGSYPTSTTSEDDDKAAMPTSTNMDIDEKQDDKVIITDSFDEILADGVDVLADSSTKTRPAFEDSVDQILEDAVGFISTSTEIQPAVEMHVSAPTYVMKSEANLNTVMVNESKPVVLPNQVTMQALLLQLPNGQTIPVQIPGTIAAQPTPQMVQSQMITVQTVSPPKNTAASVPRIVQGNTQFIHAVPNVAQQKPVIVQNLSGAVHNLPVGIVQNSGTRTVPLPTLKLGPSQLAQTGSVQQTGNQTIVISPDKHTITQNSTGLKTVIAPQIVVQSAQKKAAVSPKPQTQSTSRSSASQGSQPYTKQVFLSQRLKAALTGNITPTSTMKINHIFKIVEEVKNGQQQQQSQDALSVGSDSVSSPDEIATPAKQPRLEPQKTEAEDSEEKRKKFLERNRAAAARCRQKRKSWIYNLESKAEELTAVNNKLQKEILSLRGEVAHLKKLLIAHKDCPVTLQQKSMGQMLPMQVAQQEDNSLSSNSESLDVEPIEAFPTVNGEVSASLSVASAPSVITIEPASLVATSANVSVATSMIAGTDPVPIVTSVLTGPNSVAMIPTIVNLDFYTKQDPT